MRQGIWSDEEKAYLIAHYADQTFGAIAAALDRKEASVQPQAARLVRDGVLNPEDRCYHAIWPDEQEEYLADQWGRQSDEAVAKHLGRTVVACHIRAKRMKINRRMNVYSATDVARLFGVDLGTVRGWIRKKLLKAKKGCFGVGGKCRYRIWSVDEDSLESFVRAKGHIFDWRLMAEGEYLTRLAIRLDKADPWLTTDEAANVAGYSANCVRHWCSRGEMPFQRRANLGSRHGPHQGKLVIRRSDLLGFLAAYRERVRERRGEAARRWHARKAAKRC